MHTSKKIIASDGITSNLALTPDIATSDLPVILCLPAMGVPARKYIPLSKALHSVGIPSALFELRGIDSSSIRASRQQNFGYYELLNHDLAIAVDAVNKKFPGKPIYLLGHSLGGQLGVIFMSENPEKVSGVIGVATGLPYYKTWPFPQNVGLWTASKLIRLISSSFGYFPGRRFGFAGREARQVMSDWAYTVIHGDYRINGRRKSIAANQAHQNLKALMITIDKDILAPQHSAAKLGDKLSKSQVDYKHLVAEDFEGDSLGHFNWMKEPVPVVKQIFQWLSPD